MIEQFLPIINEGRAITLFEEIVAVPKASFAVLRSIKTGLPVKM